MFDTTGMGWIKVHQLKEGLETLGLVTGKEEIFLFLRRYNIDHDGRIKYSDFCEAFTPKR
jgi:Ca2+-binding EF-hand superfamily protein